MNENQIVSHNKNTGFRTQVILYTSFDSLFLFPSHL